MVSQRFFFMQCYGIHPIAPVVETTEVVHRWTNGEAVKRPVEEPINYTLDLKDIFNADPAQREDMDLTIYSPDDFNIKPLMTLLNPPLIRNDLLAVLQSVGVDNLELFQAIVRNPINDREHDCFTAFNVVGLADFDWARDLRREISQRDYRIKVPPYLIFRLFDDGPIVVYDTVRLAIEQSNIEGMEFIPTYERY